MNEANVTLMGTVVSEVNQRTWEDGDKLYVNVTCWRRLAENVRVSVSRGDDVIVHGRPYLREYEANGAQKKSLELDARAVGPNLMGCVGTVQRTRWGDGPEAPETPQLALAA